MMTLIFFVLLYLYFCNWSQIHLAGKTFFTKKSKVNQVKNQHLTGLLYKKTRLRIKFFTIYESDKLFGLMPGVPLYPTMILSRKLYETFNENELEWVILHEAAHCKFWHVLKLAFFQLTILLVGVYLSIIDPYKTIFFDILNAIMLSSIFIRIAQHFEYEADKFSIQNVDDPKGVISAQSKLKQANQSKLYDEKNIIRKFFSWNIMPSKRIKMANIEIRKRRIN
jgi:hypothetical protein